VISEIRRLSAYEDLLGRIREGGQLNGLSLLRSARLPLLAALHEDLARPLILLTDRSARAMNLLDELGFWAPSTRRIIFSAPTPMFYEQAAWGTATRRDRLQALLALASYQLPAVEKPALPPVIITSIRALMTRTLPRRDFIKNSKFLKTGQIGQPEAFQRGWMDLGYLPVDIVLEPGQVSRRGGILDIWPAAEEWPVRVEFFGDEIDEMRRFDPASQRTLGKTDTVLITPAKEILPGTAARLATPIENPDEFHLPLAHPAHASLLDYLPHESLVIIDDLEGVQSATLDIEEQAVRARHESIKQGVLPQDFPIPYLTWSELYDTLSAHTWFEMGRSTAQEKAELGGRFHPDERFGGQLKRLNEFLHSKLEGGGRVWVVSRQAPRLTELWTGIQEVSDLAVSPTFTEGSLTEGWKLTAEDGREIHLLTDSEIFGWERPIVRRRQAPAAEAPEANFADLKPGDWVVHVDYGIGRFSGLVQRSLDGMTREFLRVEYDGEAQLFVPVHQADRLTRYIGPGGESPAPTRLGTTEWTQAKQRVNEAVEAIARELLDLYARRQMAVGFQFSPDTAWQQELEASFPYTETPDQIAAIRAVKTDMESPRPMDRLLCGDVGYGKTEVALRAAFKAVMDGKQVALLVPTTVLAQQHYETFRERLMAFPVTVEMLSRFRNPREQDHIIEKLGQGGVDILIGTHRLLQPDVKFKDLGLVIIDEEQRFGVTHKEYLKKLRTEVDVLTLTATPIPRTLYMALTGVRDISNINTPPDERLPIITHVGPYSPELVRQAVMRELERDGQVFFVHNRVQTILGMRQHLRKLVPEAEIGIAHGQMNENELSGVMRRFSRGEIDILLCTSIIESGLDIPNANTLIVDRGDTFGLAQLYQLRGRVGRGSHRAYAFFFRHRRRSPTQEGLERLEVIAENTQLGAGYSIAMRDLEMRGAGELLGMRQSGYIATVGFHLYIRILAQAVKALRKSEGLPAPEEIAASFREGRQPVTVELPLDVGIPVEYVVDQEMRLKLYRRLANIQKEEEIDALADEFADRFGPLPEEVSNLFYQLRVKIKAEQAGLVSVALEGDQVVMRFPALPEGAPERKLPTLSPEIRTGKNAYWVKPPSSFRDWGPKLLQILSDIIQLCPAC
jgi:transcription-repair coupling factor (superfamily II helicase)